jgi:hypothetical protein
MTATLTLPAREVRGGDVVVTDHRRLPIRAARVRGDLCLLVDFDGVGRLAHADAELRVVCADVPPFQQTNQGGSDGC